MSAYRLSKRGGKYRLIDPTTGEPAKGARGNLLDNGGWDDWDEARLGKNEATAKEERHLEVERGFVRRARERYAKAKGMRREPDPTDVQMLTDAGQFDEAGALVPEASE